jgi:hypothetical protein
MNGRCQRAQAMHEGGRGSVQEFVSNAVDAVFFGGAHCFPSAITNDFLQRNSVSRTTPCGHDHIRIFRENGFGGCLFSRKANEVSACGRDQFGYPGLRRDQRLTPFLAEDASPLCSIRLPANRLDFLLHFADHLLATIMRACDSRNGSNIGVDVGERLRCQAKKAGPRLQDFGHCFFLVGDGSDHQVGTSSDDLLGACGPGVGHDGRPVIVDVRANIRAIFRASHDAVQFTNRSENYGRAGLQGNNSSRGMVNRHDKQSYRPLDSMRVARKRTSSGAKRGAGFNGAVQFSECILASFSITLSIHAMRVTL